MFIAALFPAAETWKQPTCLSTDEQVEKIWCVYTTECYSATRRKEILPFVTARIGLEGTALSEISQQRKANTV